MNAQFDQSPKSKSNQKKTTQGVLGSSMPSTVLVNAKLEMTSPGDTEELEADAMADSIVSEGKIARAITPGHSGSGIALPSQFGSQLASLQGQGSRITGDLKVKMENGFGRDFSDVRLHTDGAAAEMNDSISAKAFTYGNDIYFNRGQFNPETSEGQYLVAHELTHVVQRSGRVGRKEDPLSEKLHQYLYDRFVHQGGATYRANDSNYTPETDKEVQTRIDKIKKNGREPTAQEKEKHMKIDCDVFVREAIAYLENEIYHPGRDLEEKKRLRKQLEDLYYSNHFDQVSIARQRSTRKVASVKVKQGSIINDDLKTVSVNAPLEIFDPQKDDKLTNNEFERRASAYASTPIVIGEGEDSHTYYPIVFKGHEALLFNYNNAWYVSDNDAVEKLETKNNSTEPPLKEAIDSILKNHSDMHFDYYGFNNSIFPLDDAEKKKKEQKKKGK